MRDMLLFWSPRSPYVRRALMAAHELGLANRIELQLSVNTPGSVDPALVEVAPVGKIPSLRLPGGEMVFDSYFIIERLDLLSDGPSLFGEGASRFEQLADHAVADGLLDAAFRWIAESWRPGDAMTPVIRGMQRDKIGRCLQWLAARPLDAASPKLRDISTATALSYLDFRCAEISWRADHPALVDWYGAMAERPSFTKTAFVDGPPPSSPMQGDPA